MSFMLLGILNSQAAGGGLRYFLATVGDSAANYGWLLPHTDGGYYAAGSNFGYWTVKLDSSMAVVWEKSQTDGGTNYLRAFTVSASGDVFWNGYLSPGPAGSADVAFGKIDNSGTVQWVKTAGGTGSEDGGGVAADSLNNFYTLFSHQDVLGGTNTGLGIAKLDTNGSLQWERMYYSNGSDMFKPSNITLDTNEDLVFSGMRANTPSGSPLGVVAKVNPNGVLQWQREFTANTQQTWFESVAVTPTNYIYSGGKVYNDSVTDYDVVIVKLDASGTLIWQRQLSGPARRDNLFLCTDSNENVYGILRNNGIRTIVKYDSSGNLQWQRELLGASVSRIAIDSEDDLLISGTSNSSGAGDWDTFLLKVPNDGSLTGTYVLGGYSYVYQASSMTSGVSSLITSSASNTYVDTTLGIAALSTTVTSTSSTVELVEIG
jgi:hypothetical protein